MPVVMLLLILLPLETVAFIIYCHCASARMPVVIGHIDARP